MNGLYKCKDTNTILFVSKMINANSFRLLISNSTDHHDLILKEMLVNRIINWFITPYFGLHDDLINIFKLPDDRFCLKFYNPYIQICLSAEEFKEFVDLLAVTDDDYYNVLV